MSSGASTFCVYDDGTGPALFMGGEFTFAGGSNAFHIAKWDGQSWLPAAVNGTNGSVETMIVHDDGTGPKLYAGGDFTYFDGPVSKIAVFDGMTWSAMPGVINGAVNRLLFYDDGSGTALYAAGSMTFPTSSGYGLIRFDGSAWSSVGTGGINGGGGSFNVRAIEAFDDGSGMRLYAGGMFTVAGLTTVNNAAVWDGVQWRPMAEGVFGSVSRFCIYDDGLGGGAKLVTTGGFRQVGAIGTVDIAAWRDGWSSFGDGKGLTERVEAMAQDDTLGGGPSLFVSGSFTAVGGTPYVEKIGRWDGTTWHSLDFDCDGPVYSLAVFDDGSGKKLWAGGQFQFVNGVDRRWLVRWNGTTWSAANTGLTGPVGSLQILDDGNGPALYAGGGLKWNGTSWVTPTWTSFNARHIVEFDDGNGTKLYGTGDYFDSQLQLTRRVARLDGTSWTPLGAPFSGDSPDRLAVFQVAGVPRVIALGTFTLEGVQMLNSAAAWTGTAWIPLGQGLTNPGMGVANVRATKVWDDHTGAGPALYVAGRFTVAGVTTVRNVAKWDGTAWFDVGTGTNNDVYALQTFEHDGTSDLYAGGLFQEAGGKLAWYFSRFSNSCSSEVGVTYCLGDGSGTACPCGNASPAIDREGCDNSLGHGGRLRAVGVASTTNDSLVLTGSGMPNASALYFQGTTKVNGGLGAVFGDGLRCTAGTVVRLDLETNNAGASQYPGTGDLEISVKGAIPPAGGVTRRYQCWYRNADPSFCTPSTFNLTNAVEITWSL
jgi:hypothetical protein